MKEEERRKKTLFFKKKNKLFMAPFYGLGSTNCRATNKARATLRRQFTFYQVKEIEGEESMVAMLKNYLSSS